MENKIFPQVNAFLVQHGIASYERKCIFHERLLHQYLTRKIEGWSVKKFLEEEKIKKYALYAVTDFTVLFIKDLERANGCNTQGIICDKNAVKFHYKVENWPVIPIDELICQYKNGLIEKVIIMSVLHENEIINELLDKDILLKDIISFVSVVYSK